MITVVGDESYHPSCLRYLSNNPLTRIVTEDSLQFGRINFNPHIKHEGIEAKVCDPLKLHDSACLRLALWLSGECGFHGRLHDSRIEASLAVSCLRISSFTPSMFHALRTCCSVDARLEHFAAPAARASDERGDSM